MDDEWNINDFVVFEYPKADPAIFSCPDDEITRRLRESLNVIMTEATDEWNLSTDTSLDLTIPPQRPIDDPVLANLSRQCEFSYLQLDLFADHPETVVCWPREGISEAALDLLGAAVLEWSDCRERHSVADVVGLLRRGHAPLEQVADLAISMFRVVVMSAGSQHISLGDAHRQFLTLHRSVS